MSYIFEYVARSSYALYDALDDILTRNAKSI